METYNNGAHSLNSNVAKKLGIPKAILLNYFNNNIGASNLKQGTFIKSLHEHFNYLPAMQIRILMRELQEDNYLYRTKKEDEVFIVNNIKYICLKNNTEYKSSFEANWNKRINNIK